MNKYQPLNKFLCNYKENYIKLTFTSIEDIISSKLPVSASKYRAWWANGGHVQANSWLEANWKVNNVLLGEYVEFIRVS
jgi:hypothetical protein